MPLIVLLPLLLLSLLTVAPAAPPAGKNWTQVWSEEFDGSQLDPAKWERLGDFKRQSGYWLKEDSYLDGQGHLVLRVKQDAQGRYTAGGIRTRGRFERTFGYFEARVKFPAQQGHWCAFWLMGRKVVAGPNEGRDGTEIDVMERAWLTDRIDHTLHWGGYGPEHKMVRHAVRNAGLNDGGWHVFGLDWTPTNYVFYVDGHETWRTNAGGVAQVPEYVKLTEEVGNFGTGPDVWGTGSITNAALPDYCLVDYVRVYESAPASPPQTGESNGNPVPGAQSRLVQKDPYENSLHEKN